MSPRHVATAALLVGLAIGPVRVQAASLVRAESAEPVTHALAERLRANGRAEATIERLVYDPISGRTDAVRGELSLERPDRAALTFEVTGERLTLRSDGGEWLQPSLRQMIRFGADDAAGVLRWWGLLVRGETKTFTARRTGQRRWTVYTPARDGLASDSATVALGPDGLPMRLEVLETASAPAIYRFRDWKFSKPQGREAFVTRAPRDYEIVPLH